MGTYNVKKVQTLFPDFSEDQLIYVNTYGRKANRVYDLLKIDSRIVGPYNGQRYVLIGDWLYLVDRSFYKNNDTYILHIKHTLNLECITLNS